MKLTDAFFQMLYPPRCIVCDVPVLEDGYCKNCKDKIRPITEDTCFNCGIVKKYCECNRFIYHFDGMVAPYLNEEFAQQAVYNLKFREKFSCVNTFGDQMAEFAAKTFGVENIDLICFVPASKSSLRYRGFNQSEMFARRISEKLGIEVDDGILFKNETVKTQHDIKTVKERFLNVRDGYYTKRNIRGKSILLVDDIKTSGASLDECARQLKFAGAERVYCVTALVSVLRRKNNDPLKK